jgi:hypothetical protein
LLRDLVILYLRRELGPHVVESRGDELAELPFGHRGRRGVGEGRGGPGFERPGMDGGTAARGLPGKMTTVLEAAAVTGSGADAGACGGAGEAAGTAGASMATWFTGTRGRAPGPSGRGAK